MPYHASRHNYSYCFAHLQAHVMVSMGATEEDDDYLSEHDADVVEPPPLSLKKQTPHQQLQHAQHKPSGKAAARLDESSEQDEDGDEGSEYRWVYLVIYACDACVSVYCAHDVGSSKYGVS
jgi:hypothetical protein